MEIITLRLSGTNCYLLANGGRFVLIDTGYTDDWELFRTQLSRNAIQPAQISHVILTHHHDDHCGLLNNLVGENPNLKVVMSDNAKVLLTKGENDRSRGGGMINAGVKRLWVFKRLFLSIRLKKRVEKKNNLKFPPYFTRPNDILITEETRLKDIGIDVDGVIFRTPGHSDDSISVLLDDGDCFVGDAAANFLQFAGTHYCVIFITDLDEYYGSWRTILSKNASRIFPAHGGSFPAAKLKENLGRNRKEDMIPILA